MPPRKKDPNSKLREAYSLELSTGQAVLRLPARMAWEDRHRLKSLIDLVPNPPCPAEDSPPVIIQGEVDEGGGISE